MISDIADGTSPHAGIARGTSFSSGDASVQNTWQYLYEVVHRSNTVIRNVSAMDIDETVKTRVIGEAKFLRAMAYFRMLNCWEEYLITMRAVSSKRNSPPCPTRANRQKPSAVTFSTT